METFIIKLAVAVVPLITLIISVNISSRLSSLHSRRLLVRHCRCCHVPATSSAGGSIILSGRLS